MEEITLYRASANAKGAVEILEAQARFDGYSYTIIDPQSRILGAYRTVGKDRFDSYTGLALNAGDALTSFIEDSQKSIASLEKSLVVRRLEMEQAKLLLRIEEVQENWEMMKV